MDNVFFSHCLAGGKFACECPLGQADLTLFAKETTNAFCLSRNTVRKYFRKFQETGLTVGQLLSMSDHHLYELFVAGKEREWEASQRHVELEALLPEYASHLSRKGMTRKQLYEEYRSTHSPCYQKTTFNRFLRRYMLKTRIIGHVEHHAGDQMYIDFAGSKLEVCDEVTGELKSAEVFVAVLPCSHYTYCEAVWSQRKEVLISACENAVKLMYRSVYVDLEGRIFTSLAALNESILISLDEFNGKKMAGRKHSRRELFTQMEYDYLRPLPAVRYQMKERRSITVMRNGYITLFKHHYSLPKQYVGKRVDVVFDAEPLEIYHGLRLVTTHHRDDTPYGYTQKSSHNLPVRKGSCEKDINEVFARAGQIGNIMLNYLKEVEQDKKYPPIVFRSCRGILSLEKKFGQERLVAACACASMMRRYGYDDVLDILENGDDSNFMPGSEGMLGDETRTLAEHKNIRGKEYYSRNNTNNSKQ